MKPHRQHLQERAGIAARLDRLLHLLYVAARAERRAVAGQQHRAHGDVLVAGDQGVEQRIRQRES